MISEVMGRIPTGEFVRFGSCPFGCRVAFMKGGWLACFVFFPARGERPSVSTHLHDLLQLLFGYVPLKHSKSIACVYFQ